MNKASDVSVLLLPHLLQRLLWLFHNILHDMLHVYGSVTRDCQKGIVGRTTSSSQISSPRVKDNRDGPERYNRTYIQIKGISIWHGRESPTNLANIVTMKNTLCTWNESRHDPNANTSKTAVSYTLSVLSNLFYHTHMHRIQLPSLCDPFPSPLTRPASSFCTHTVCDPCLSLAETALFILSKYAVHTTVDYFRFRGLPLNDPGQAPAEAAPKMPWRGTCYGNRLAQSLRQHFWSALPHEFAIVLETLCHYYIVASQTALWAVPRLRYDWHHKATAMSPRSTSPFDHHHHHH